MKNIPQNINPVNHKMNWFQQFLIICSGGNLHILRKTPSEWNKFAGIGGIVLFTAVFATLSAGYAMFTVFDDLWASAGFGLLWGLMIFNLDRYIVSSIKKTGTWGNQILMAIPRLILATFQNLPKKRGKMRWSVNFIGPLVWLKLFLSHCRMIC